MGEILNVTGIHKDGAAELQVGISSNAFAIKRSGASNEIVIYDPNSNIPLAINGSEINVNSSECVSEGEYSSAGGYQSQALGETSFAYGNNATAITDNSVSFGNSNSSGGRGYTYYAINTADKKIYLNMTETDVMNKNVLEVIDTPGVNPEMYTRTEPEPPYVVDLSTKTKTRRIYLRHLGDAQHNNLILTGVGPGYITYDIEPNTTLDLWRKAESGYHYFIVSSQPNIGPAEITRNAFTFGEACYASASGAIAGGDSSIAAGQYSVAIGNTVFSGYGGLATGYHTEAIGKYTQAFGYKSIAFKESSHAEGMTTEARGKYSHSEGNLTIAGGASSHAEGQSVRAEGDASHAEGSWVKDDYMNQDGTVSEGNEPFESSGAFNSYAHSEGRTTRAEGSGSHSEGRKTIAAGSFSHAEGDSSRTSTSGHSAHAEGQSTEANGHASHAEGQMVKANGVAAHAEGAWIEGDKTSETYAQAGAFGDYSHSEGQTTQAKGTGSHAEGRKTIAEGKYSHAEGSECKATGTSAHAEGQNNTATGSFSHVGGRANQANGRCETVIGEFSVAGKLDEMGKSYLFRVGNGATESSRSNAMIVDWDGNTKISGNLQDMNGNKLSPYVEMTFTMKASTDSNSNWNAWNDSECVGYYDFGAISKLSMCDLRYTPIIIPVTNDEAGIPLANADAISKITVSRDISSTSNYKLKFIATDSSAVTENIEWKILFLKK